METPSVHDDPSCREKTRRQAAYRETTNSLSGRDTLPAGWNTPHGVVMKLGEHCTLSLVKGDITQWRGDAIVNAANARLLGGSGVDGAIHRAAGPRLVEACRAIPEVRPGVRCPTGEARRTDAFDLPVRYVVHTVGPIFRDLDSSRPLLQAAYINSLRVANEAEIESLAFPAISCGAYRFPLEDAAEVAIETCAQFHGDLRTVAFVLFNDPILEVWQQTARRLLGD